jgi:hypothetical protein
MGALASFVTKTVTELENVDLTNDEKRETAFNKIKEEAIGRGKDLRNSFINLAIEAAVNLLRK